MSDEEIAKINKMLLRDNDTLASNEDGSVDRRLPTRKELLILRLIKPICPKSICPKCKRNDMGSWHLYSTSKDGIPIEILWICHNHPEKSEYWPLIQYNINDLLNLNQFESMDHILKKKTKFSRIKQWIHNLIYLEGRGFNRDVSCLDNSHIWSSECKKCNSKFYSIDKELIDDVIKNTRPIWKRGIWRTRKNENKRID